MLTDLNETIKQILLKKAPLEPSEVDIVFDTPDREWSASISKPTINLYLYDIRENHDLRGTEWLVEKNENGMATRKKNANRINISYLITVWTNNVEDQHRLLWQVLATLFRYPLIPKELLVGRLAEQNYPIITQTAQPDGPFGNSPDFWGALGNEIKPSINYMVAIPLDQDIVFTATLARTKTVSVHPGNADAEKLVQVAGIIHEAGKPTKIYSGATVLAVEAGMSTKSDENGRYSLAMMSEGEYTFRVLVSGKKVGEKSVTIPGKNYNLEI